MLRETHSDPVAFLCLAFFSQRAQRRDKSRAARLRKSAAERSCA